MSALKYLFDFFYAGCNAISEREGGIIISVSAGETERYTLINKYLPLSKHCDEKKSE
jgi:hypothetical protein